MKDIRKKENRRKTVLDKTFPQVSQIESKVSLKGTNSIIRTTFERKTTLERIHCTVNLKKKKINEQKRTKKNQQEYLKAFTN